MALLLFAEALKVESRALKDLCFSTLCGGMCECTHMPALDIFQADWTYWGWQWVARCRVQVELDLTSDILTHDSREDVCWWPQLMKADRGLNAAPDAECRLNWIWLVTWLNTTTAPVIMTAWEWGGEYQHEKTAMQQLSFYVFTTEVPTTGRWHRVLCRTGREWNRKHGLRDISHIKYKSVSSHN